MPITQVTPPEPPEVKLMPVHSDIIEIVDDNVKIDDSVLNLEDDSDIGVKIMDYVEEVQDENLDEEYKFVIVEQKPAFRGGEAGGFSKWVMSQIV